MVPLAQDATLALMPVAPPALALMASANFSQTRGTPKKMVGELACDRWESHVYLAGRM